MAMQESKSWPFIPQPPPSQGWNSPQGWNPPEGQVWNNLPTAGIIPQPPPSQGWNPQVWNNLPNTNANNNAAQMPAQIGHQGWAEHPQHNLVQGQPHGGIGGPSNGWHGHQQAPNAHMPFVNPHQHPPPLPPPPPPPPPPQPAGFVGRLGGEASPFDRSVVGSSWEDMVKNDNWAQTLQQLMQAQPVLTFKEAIKPLHGVVFNLEDRGNQAYLNAQQIIQKPQGKYSSPLWLDGIAIINLYSMEWINSEQSWYSALKRAMYNQKRTEPGQLQPWLPSIKLLDEALVRLPPDFRIPPGQRVRAFRGVKWRYPCPAQPAVGEHYPVGSQRMGYGFSSYTTDCGVLRDDAFCGMKGPRTFFDARLFEGYRITDFSASAGEEEILVRPLSVFRVLHTIDFGGDPDMGPDVVVLEEVPRQPMTAPAPIDGEQGVNLTAILSTQLLNVDSCKATLAMMDRIATSNLNNFEWWAAPAILFGGLLRGMGIHYSRKDGMDVELCKCVAIMVAKLLNGNGNGALGWASAEQRGRLCIGLGDVFYHMLEIEPQALPPGNENFYKYVGRAIASLVRMGHTQNKDMYSHMHGLHARLVELVFAVQNQESLDGLLYAMQTLALNHQQNKDAFLVQAQKMHRQMIEILRQHSQNRDIARRIFGVISSLADNHPGHQYWFHMAEAHDVVLNILSETIYQKPFMYDESLCRFGANVIGYLSEGRKIQGTNAEPEAQARARALMNQIIQVHKGKGIAAQSATSALNKI